AALALAPGEDVGPNLVAAWFRHVPTGWRAWLNPRRWLGKSRSPSVCVTAAPASRLLSELVNASLLITTREDAHRYRYHRLPRDYARSKLTTRQEEVRWRLMACFADWNMVRAEFDAVGAFTLAGQYRRLREGQATVPTRLAPWYHFVRGQAPVLGSH